MMSVTFHVVVDFCCFVVNHFTDCLFMIIHVTELTAIKLFMYM